MSSLLSLFVKNTNKFLVTVMLLISQNLFSFDSWNMPRLSIRGQLTIRDFLGNQYSTVKLNNVETDILNNILMPALNYSYDSMIKLFMGAHIVCNDGGILYEKMHHFGKDFFADTISYKESPVHVLWLPVLGKLLAGKQDSSSFIRLEDSSSLFWLRSNPNKSSGLWSYYRSLIQKKGLNRGPFGFSHHTEDNPLVLDYE